MSRNSLGSKMPRLFTRMSARGSASSSTCTPAGVLRSAATPRISAPGTIPRTRSTALAARSTERALTTTAAPASASPAAMASPMPWPDPETMAVFPVRSILMSFSLLTETGLLEGLAAQEPGRGHGDDQREAGEDRFDPKRRAQQGQPGGPDLQGHHRDDGPPHVEHPGLDGGSAEEHGGEHRQQVRRPDRRAAAAENARLHHPADAGEQPGAGEGQHGQPPDRNTAEPRGL